MWVRSQKATRWSGSAVARGNRESKTFWSVWAAMSARSAGMDGFGAPRGRVGVQNPDHQSGRKYLCRVGLRDRSLVTSGGSQRYYTVDGVQYHHIIDPKTLMPARYFWAVSVIAKDSGTADALSTALYNLPYTQGHSLAERFPDIEALWVMRMEHRR